MMVFGIIGIEIFQTETQATLARGEQLTLGRYVMIYESMDQFDSPDGRFVIRAVVSVYQDGKYVGELYPQQDYYYAPEMAASIPGVRSTLEDDLSVMLVGWEPTPTGGATFKVFLKPLVNFLWLGGLLFIFSGLVAAWPDRKY